MGLQSHLAEMGFLQVLEDSRTVLTAAEVLPDGPFPQDEKLKDGMVSSLPTLGHSLSPWNIFIVIPE